MDERGSVLDAFVDTIAFDEFAQGEILCVSSVNVLIEKLTLFFFLFFLFFSSLKTKHPERWDCGVQTVLSVKSGNLWRKMKMVIFLTI